MNILERNDMDKESIKFLEEYKSIIYVKMTNALDINNKEAYSTYASLYHAISKHIDKLRDNK